MAFCFSTFCGHFVILIFFRPWSNSEFTKPHSLKWWMVWKHNSSWKKCQYLFNLINHAVCCKIEVFRSWLFFDTIPADSCLRTQVAITFSLNEWLFWFVCQPCNPMQEKLCRILPDCDLLLSIAIPSGLLIHFFAQGNFQMDDNDWSTKPAIVMTQYCNNI